jgi:hypothetical protein
MNAKNFLLSKVKFRLWLESVEDSLPPAEFIDSRGMITLYRYSHGNRGEKYEIDPSRTKPQSYSRSDYQRTSKPRTFFYLDINEKENLVGNHLYVAEYPAGKIYNLLKDPLGLKEEAKGGYNGINRGHLDFDRLLNSVQEAGYDGVYYKPEFHVVNMFIAVTGVASTEDQVRAKLHGKVA